VVTRSVRGNTEEKCERLRHIEVVENYKHKPTASLFLFCNYMLKMQVMCLVNMNQEQRFTEQSGRFNCLHNNYTTDHVRVGLRNPFQISVARFVLYPSRRLLVQCLHLRHDRCIRRLPNIHSHLIISFNYINSVVKTAALNNQIITNNYIMTYLKHII